MATAGSLARLRAAGQGVDEHERPVRLAAAVVLTAVALRGLVVAARAGSVRGAGRDRAPVAGAVAGRDGARARSAFGRFVALTALNPLMLVYFATVATALGADGRSPRGAAAFALGVLAASWGWQALLAVAGSGAAHLLIGRARSALPVVGNALVLALAVALAAR